MECPECMVSLPVNLVLGKFRFGVIEEHIEKGHLTNLHLECSHCSESFRSQTDVRRHLKLQHQLARTLGNYRLPEVTSRPHQLNLLYLAATIVPFQNLEDSVLEEIQRLFPAINQGRLNIFRQRYRRLLPPNPLPPLSPAPTPPTLPLLPTPLPNLPTLRTKKLPSVKPPQSSTFAQSAPDNDTEFKVPKSPLGGVKVVGGIGRSPERLVICGGCDREVAAYDGKGFRKDAVMSHMEKSHTDSQVAFRCAFCSFNRKWRRDIQIHTKANHATITQDSILMRQEVMEQIACDAQTYFSMLNGIGDRLRKRLPSHHYSHAKRRHAPRF